MHVIAAIQERQTGSSIRFLGVACALVFLLALTGCGSKKIAPSGRTTQEVSSSKANQVLATAKKQIGTHYKWGGSSPKGFDCSGLIWWSYRQHGINVPRVAKDQAVTGKGVKASQMRPGDILVFKIGSGLHTGMYSGRGKFIHAPSSGKRVREDDVNSKYWKPKLKAVRRVVASG